MAYYYTDTTREDDPHTLPDVEVFQAKKPSRLVGGVPNDAPLWPAGWYFAFLDGGLDCWASDPSGPYESEEAALAAAREEADTCPHGVPYNENADTCEACDPPELWALVSPAGDFVSTREEGASAGPIRPGVWRTDDFSVCAAWASEDAALQFRDSLGLRGFTARLLTDSEARGWGR